jgi:heptosyltransferase III
MQILLVKLRHIGDALLMTPVIRALREAHTGCEIDVVVRRGTEGILSGCTDIRTIHTTASAEKSMRGSSTLWQDLRLLADIRSARYDVAIDLGNNDRGRTIVGLSGARRRCANSSVYPIHWPWKMLLTHLGGSQWSYIHRAEADFLNVADFVSLPQYSPGPLVFEPQRATAPPGFSLSTGRPHVLFHPGTRWRRKRWPETHWIALGRSLIEQNYQIVISVSPDQEEVELGDLLTCAIGPQQCVSTAGKLQWQHLAWLLLQARLFVGVDTAAMHLAAAMRRPTVALFGPDSDVRNWSPWQTPHEIIRFNADEPGSLRQALAAAQSFLPPPPIPLNEVTCSAFW